MAETVRMTLRGEEKDVPLEELAAHMAEGWNQVRTEAGAAAGARGDSPRGTAPAQSGAPAGGQEVDKDV